MFKADVIKHFGGSQIAVARAIGLTKGAVSQWPEIVPLRSALKLQSVTGGVLGVDMSIYGLPTLPRRIHRRAAVNS